MRRPTRAPVIPDASRIFVAIIAVALVCLYSAAVADFFARAPSAQMSREREVARVSWIRPGVIRPDVITMPAQDGRSAAVLVVDEGTVRVLDINALGEVTADAELELDLTGSRALAGYQRSNGHLRLFSLTDAVRQLDIDRAAGTVTATVLSPEASDFRSAGPVVVMKTGDGLYGLNTEAGRGDSGAARRVLAGSVTHFEIDASDGEVAIIAAMGTAGTLYDLRLVHSDDGFDRPRTDPLLEGSADDTFRRPVAVQTDGETTRMLYVRKEDRYGVNELTVWRVEADTARTIDHAATSVPILNSRYQFIDGTGDNSSFLMRYRTIYGYNLVLCTVGESGAALADYTKTRALSVQSLLFPIDGSMGLVFSDIGDGGRTVYYAGSHPDVVRSTTRWSAKVIGRAAIVMLTNTLMAMLVGTIYLFIVSIVPYVAVEGARRFAGRGLRVNYVLGAAGALIYTGLKLAVTYFVIHNTANYRFRAPLIGEEPQLYVVLAAMSVLSYLLVAPLFRITPRAENPITGPFFRFLLIDAIQYTLVFVLYVVTSILLDKI